MLKMFRIPKMFFSLIFLLLCSVMAFSQEKKVAATPKQLQAEIATMDSLLFTAYNTRNLDKLKSYFTEDLEWYQDNGGLLSLQTVMENFDGIFKRDYVLTRTLVKGSMEVHPIKDFGAIETGSHQFRHTENGKEETGTFKFLMIWKKGDKGWQVSRVVSYDH
jgi:ketosteroid isomerase-like protein